MRARHNGSKSTITYRASDFFQDLWADVTYGAKNGGSFSEMMGSSISNKPQLTFGWYTLLNTDTDICMHICIWTADYTVNPVLSGHSKKKTNYRLMQVKNIAGCSKGSILQYFDLKPPFVI